MSFKPREIHMNTVLKRMMAKQKRGKPNIFGERASPKKPTLQVYNPEWLKTAAFALGIPEKKKGSIRQVKKEGPNETWTLSVSEHDAERAGKHYDVRLIDPRTDQAHSWAVPAARWPKSGEKLWAAPQPTHTGEYARRRGTWKVGSEYGRGAVISKMVEPVEVIDASDKKITFVRYPKGQKIENVSLVNVGKGALLYNHTPTSRDVGGITVPDSKKKYKEIEYASVDPKNDEEILQAKIDGAHLVLGLQANKPARVFSYRRSKRAPIIEHTPRFKDWHKRKVPPGMGGTVLRAEGWASDQWGKALSASDIAGILNSSIPKARETLDKKKAKLRLSVIDIDKYKGRDVSKLPFQERFPIIKKIVRAIPGLELPPMAEDKRAKVRLLKKIRDNKLKETSEGVVVHNKNTHVPIKAKLNKEYDGKVVRTFMGRGKYKDRGAGGLVVREENTGKEVRVGTGFSDKLRKKLYENPNLLKGMTVKMKALGQYPSGNLRMPVYSGLHLDKNDPERLSKLHKIAMRKLFAMRL